MDDRSPNASSVLRARPRVLYIDAHDAARDMMTEMLTWAGGFRVVAALTIGEAALALGSAPFSLVIADSTLPDGSGMEFIEGARFAGLLARDVPVVLLASESTLVHPLELPAGAVLETKPLRNPEAFVERLRALMFDADDEPCEHREARRSDRA